jgi:hypothetical protein
VSGSLIVRIAAQSRAGRHCAVPQRRDPSRAFPRLLLFRNELL